MSRNRPDWMRSLPTILLALRTDFPEDFSTTSADLLYGTTLRIPGQLVEDTKILKLQTDFVTLLRNHFNEIRPHPPTRHTSKDHGFVFKALSSCSHVLLRTDAVRKSLQPPYEGPFAVVSRAEKNFVIEYKGKQIRVSIDRLKPCFVENAESAASQSNTPNITTSLVNGTDQTAVTDSKSVTDFQNGAETIKRQRKVTFSPDLTNARGEQTVCIPKQTSTRVGRITKPPARFLDALTLTDSLAEE